jgi:signal transduction histidine kinase/ligand-binding sensor domain-containing protein
LSNGSLLLRGVLSLAALLFICFFLPIAAWSEGETSKDYIRTDFTVENGLPDDVVNAIVRTQNGLLWIGTQAGLATFDGREFTPIPLKAFAATSQGGVDSLIESSSGDLWVGTNGGVVRIPKAALDQFNPELLDYYHLGAGPSDQVQAMLQSGDGTVWAGTNHGLYRLAAGKFITAIPDITVNRISRTSKDHVLLTTGRGVVDWDGRTMTRFPRLTTSRHVEDSQIFDAHEDHTGTIWYATAAGIERQGAKPFPPLLSRAAATTSAFHIYEDSRGQVWVINGEGVYLVAANSLDFTVNVHARSFYASPDGDLWIGTNGSGLIHLKPRIVRMYTKEDGLPNDIAMTVFAAHDGKIWVGSNCGLSVLEGERFKKYNEKDGLLNACVWSLAEDQNHNLWIGTYGGGIFRFRDNHFAQFSTPEGLASNVVVQVMAASDGSLWVATPDGMSHMQNGRFKNYTVADGLSSNQVLSVFEDQAGTIWAATQGGIDRFVGGRFLPFPTSPYAENPLSTHLSQDSQGNIYAADSPRGLSIIENNRIDLFNEDLKVLNMAESPHNDLWFSGTNGILRVRLKDLHKFVTDHTAPLDYSVIDRADGLGSIQCSVGAPNMTISPDNKLWVATVKGVAMLDLDRLSAPSGNPKVFVAAVTIGKDRNMAGKEAILPPGTNHVELHFEAVDLGSPEKVRMQYRLDGVDPAWLDADATRSAVYTNIPIGTHAFHVRASNRDGVWDHVGIVYEITQQPYFYQTLWFRFAIACFLICLLTAAYFFRVQQIMQQTRRLLEERLEERERVARELHDTLLQGVLSAAMQLDVLEDRLPEDSPTKPPLTRVLQTMRQVIEEGRNALLGLRTRDPEGADLAVAFSRLGIEFAVDEKTSYRVIAQSPTRPLFPYVRNEVYRIGREAIANAILHASAASVEVELEYANSYFRILVRDDGRGIDSHVLEAGRQGHWGLVGMRERSEKIGATFRLRSLPGAGTEVELTIPGAIAFEQKPRGAAPRWLSWLNRENFKVTPTNQKKRE